MKTTELTKYMISMELSGTKMYILILDKTLIFSQTIQSTWFELARPEEA